MHRTQFARHRDRQAGATSDPPDVKISKPKPVNALTEVEEQAVLEILNSPEFIDRSPYSVYHGLLDRGQRLCSVSTMYRLLARKGLSVSRQARRRKASHPKPQLSATGPRQVWSWDVTLLRGPVRGVFYYLYAMIDIYSRKVVAWMLTKREGEDLAAEFIREACKREGIQPGQLTIHSDRGSSMKSLAVKELYKWLGVERSLGRPTVSDDNPYSEALFKTVKYCPAFPGWFRTFEDAANFCRGFFEHYNDHHYHSGICFLTPQSVHVGTAAVILEARHQTELQAYKDSPKRFPNGEPVLKQLPNTVWINDPMRTLPDANINGALATNA